MFSFNHVNFNVLNLEKSLAFYRDALGLSPIRETSGENDLGPFKLVYLSDGTGRFTLELTWLSVRKEPYDLGEGEFHLAFTTDDPAAAHARHQAMGCICFENPDMGIYFIEDPDGYWIEIVPEKQ